MLSILLIITRVMEYFLENNVENFYNHMNKHKFNLPPVKSTADLEQIAMRVFHGGVTLERIAVFHYVLHLYKKRGLQKEIIDGYVERNQYEQLTDCEIRFIKEFDDKYLT